MEDEKGKWFTKHPIPEPALACRTPNCRVHIFRIRTDGSWACPTCEVQGILQPGVSL